MTADLSKHFDNVFKQLERSGLLLVSDQHFPSVAYLIARRRRKGSWWSHPEAQTIFAVTELLDDHPDVLIMKLISGKVTFVHRELWGRIYSIGVAREDWQMKPLSPAAKSLLKKIDSEGRVQTGGLGKAFDPKPGDAARELEFHLLIHSRQAHTQSGAHHKTLQTWDEWATSAGFKARAKNPAAARRFLEERVDWILKEYGGPIIKDYGGHVRLPWPSRV